MKIKLNDIFLLTLIEFHKKNSFFDYYYIVILDHLTILQKYTKY